MSLCLFFFFKQKTAYEMRISDWSSDVCSSDLQNGLRIDMPEETLEVPVEAHHLCDVCTLNQVYDVVLLYVKAYDTRWACELIKPYLAPEGLLVGVQNAMTAGDIADIVGPSRTLGRVVEDRKSTRLNSSD